MPNWTSKTDVGGGQASLKLRPYLATLQGAGRSITLVACCSQVGQASRWLNRSIMQCAAAHEHGKLQREDQPQSRFGR